MIPHTPSNFYSIITLIPVTTSRKERYFGRLQIRLSAFGAQCFSILTLWIILSEAYLSRLAEGGGLSIAHALLQR